MHVIQLQRVSSSRHPNFCLYALLYSLTQGLLIVVVGRFWKICSQHTRQSKMIFVGLIVLSKAPVGLYYMIVKWRGKIKETEVTPLSVWNLIIPSSFRILIYVLLLITFETGRSYYFAVGFILNLMAGQLLFEYNTTLSRSNLKSRLFGVLLISIACLVGVTDWKRSINLNLYLIYLATCIVVLQGEVFLNSKILRLYKPRSEEVISKYFVAQLLIFILGYLMATILQELDIINTQMGARQLLEYIMIDPYLFWIGVFWVMVFGSLFHIIYHSLLSNSSTAQHMYNMSTSIIWYQLNFMLHDFRAEQLISVFLIIISTLVYYRIVKPQRLFRFVSLTLRKSSNALPLN